MMMMMMIGGDDDNDDADNDDDNDDEGDDNDDDEEEEEKEDSVKTMIFRHVKLFSKHNKMHYFILYFCYLHALNNKEIYSICIQ